MTPLRRQYLQIKRQYPDTIVFFRLGDFYETFDDDAKITSAELEIVLTGRDMGKGERVPMAGIPHHAINTYLGKLVSRGYKVAIVEQTSDPATSKGLVDRDVTMVVTPGTVVEPSMLAANSNNYLAAAVYDGKNSGVAYVDITTGEFATTQFAGGLTALQQELARLSPAECLIPKINEHVQSNLADITDEVKKICHPSPLEVTAFALERGREALQRQFDVSSLEGFGCAHLPLAIRAAGAIVHYLSETQRVALGQLSSLRSYSTGAFMALDPTTRRNLELTQTTRGQGSRGSLLWVLDHTATPMGGRLLRHWLSEPLLDVNELKKRQDAVEDFVQNTIRRERLTKLLAHCADLERLINRVGLGLITPRELLSLKHTLETAALVGQTFKEEGLSIIGTKYEAVPDTSDVVGLIAQAIVLEPPNSLSDGGVIAAGFSDELDHIRLSSKDARQWIAGLERCERERTGIKSLKVGYNRVFGYFLEVTNPQLEAPLSEIMRRQFEADTAKKPGMTTRSMPNTVRDYLEDFCGYIRKQTLSGAERYVTADLKEYESQVMNAQERIIDLETLIFKQICEQVTGANERIHHTANILAHLDVFATLAEVAIRNNYCRPTLTEDDDLEIIGGRHPVVELSLEEPFVPNDIHLSCGEEQIILLTGPNMAGKSTYLRQVALIVLLAQIGSFVPAISARIGTVDRIFTRVGAQDDIATGQSTFMVEMIETANLLNQSTPKSLLVLDEVGRGTSTYDGMAIAQAVVEYIHNHPRCGSRTLFATHYHELTELEKRLPRVRNHTMAVLEEGDKVVFLRKVVPGGADRSYGIYVAKLAGLPRGVTRRAEEILKELEIRAERGASRPTRPSRDNDLQLSLFVPNNALIDEIAALDVLSITPIEALNKLYELKQKAKEQSPDGER